MFLYIYSPLFSSLLSLSLSLSLSSEPHGTPSPRPLKSPCPIISLSLSLSRRVGKISLPSRMVECYSYILFPFFPLFFFFLFSFSLLFVTFLFSSLSPLLHFTSLLSVSSHSCHSQAYMVDHDIHTFSLSLTLFSHHTHTPTHTIRSLCSLS